MITLIIEIQDLFRTWLPILFVQSIATSVYVLFILGILLTIYICWVMIL